MIAGIAGVVLAFATFGSAFAANIYQDGKGDASALDVLVKGILPVEIWFLGVAAVLFGVARSFDRDRAPRTFGLTYTVALCVAFAPLVVLVPVALVLGGVRSLREGKLTAPPWDWLAWLTTVAVLIVVAVIEGA